MEGQSWHAREGCSKGKGRTQGRVAYGEAQGADGNGKDGAGGMVLQVAGQVVAFA